MHLTSVFLTDIYTTTLTISTSLVLYLYMDIRKIKWMNEWMNELEDMGSHSSVAETFKFSGKLHKCWPVNSN